VSVIISPAALAQGLGNAGIKILDARFSLADATLGRLQFEKAHIPGAQYVDLNTDLSAAKTDARLGRHPLPSAAQWQAVLERLGITPEDRVVVYDQADGAMAAARAWFLFALAGHQHVSVLDGGLDAWQEAGLPLSNGLQCHGKSEYPVGFDQRLLILADELRAVLQSGDDTRLLDARAAERFRGEIEPIDAKAGHIPGAINRPYTQNLHNGRFKPSQQLRAEFEQLLGTHHELILSCGSGVTACHHALALNHAGMAHYRLYAPSWSGWIADEGNPIAVGA
jgi:thiosulfate/3-mercaptopyruvate sulfurtransferase